MKRLENNVTIITGGGRGIGFGVAQAFAEEGAKLVLTGRTEQTLLDAKKSIEDAYQSEVLIFAADGTDEQAVRKVVAGTVQHYGKINTVINNAQASKDSLLKDLAAEDFDFTVRSNLYATFFYMRECYPYLKETKGTVINFASGAGLFGKYGTAGYGTAKEGIRGLTRVAATEWAPDQISVNAVVPLVMSDSMKQFRKYDPEGFDRMVKPPPFGRFGDAKKDVGRVCVFLASEDASFITGETITIQGGNSLRP